MTWRCQLQFADCTIVATEIDDIIPVSMLGNVSREDLTDDNRQSACSHCHHIKTEQYRLARIKEAAARRAARLRLPQAEHPGEMR